MRASLPDVKFGVASITNRVLPHLFPSADQDVFRATLSKALGVDRPAPGTGFIVAPGQVASRNATTFSALAGMGTQGFFSPEARKRVVVVLTDGESPDVEAARVGSSFRRAGIQAVFLRFWGSGERVFTNGEAEPQYRPQPESLAILESLAAATAGRAFDEADLTGAERQVHADLGSGKAEAVASERGHRLPLAPYLAAVAILPLGLLLWRRDRWLAERSAVRIASSRSGGSVSTAGLSSSCGTMQPPIAKSLPPTAYSARAWRGTFRLGPRRHFRLAES